MPDPKPILEEASDLDSTDFEWNNPDEECQPDFTLDELEWSETYE